MELFDSHAHYDDKAFDDDREELLGSFASRGIVGVINAGASVASSAASIALAGRYPFVWCAVGIHPEEAAGAQPGDLARIEALAAAGGKVVAIGEIGLDYSYEGADRALQLTLFERQLALACRLRLPVIVHDREAHADTLALLQKYRPRGVVHCYSGSAETAGELISLGLYLGFTGAVTFKNNKKAPAVLAAVPFDRVLIETDCPYMAPVPLRGRRCDSTMLEYTVSAVARMAGLAPEEAAKKTAANARALFSIG